MVAPAPVSLSVLFVGEDSSTLEAALDGLADRSMGATVQQVADAETAVETLATDGADCLVLAGADAVSTVETVREAGAERPIVVLAADEAAASAAIAAGATDYVLADLAADNPHLLADRIRRSVGTAPDTALPGSPDWYEALLERSVDALTVLSADGTIAYQNPSVQRLLGYEPEELLGADSLEYVHPEDRDRVEATFVRLYEGGDRTTEDLTFRFQAADGSWEWLESVVTTRRDRGIDGYVVNSSVISERMEREREVDRYETLLSVLPDTIAITDLEGVHQEIYGFEGWSGYDREELLGESMELTTPPESRDKATEEVTELIVDEDRDKAIFEMDLEAKDGERIPFETHATTLPPNDEGEIPGTMHVLRNVSDRKERERELEMAETVFQNVQDGVFLLDISEEGEFRYQRANEAFESLTGYTEDEIRGKTPREVLPDPSAAEALEAEMAAAVDDRAVKHREWTFDMPNLDPYWEIWFAPVVSDDEVTSIVGVARDITERKERRRELELKNRAMDEAPIGITISEATEDGATLVYANQGYESLTGYGPADLEGEDWWTVLLGEETDDATLESLTAALEEGDHASAELQLYRKDGAPRWFQVSLSPLRDDEGDVTHYLSFQQDITDIKEYETEIERRFDEFADVFAADLRDPIETAQAALDRARESGDDEAIAEAAEWLDRADDLLADLATVHSFSVPSRDHSESALAGAMDDA